MLIAASGIGSRLGEYTENVNKSLVRVGDQFAICRIIEKFDASTTRFVVTTGYHGTLVQEFLQLAYPTHTIQFVEVDKYDGVGSSLGYSLLQAESSLRCPFTFFCCDSVVLDDVPETAPHNALFVASSPDSTSYASVNVSGGRVQRLNPKGESKFDFVYTGVSFIFDHADFWSALRDAYTKNPNNGSLSDVDAIKAMLAKGRAFDCCKLANWYDTGNIPAYHAACQVFQAKYDVLFKKDESICFLQDRVIKFFADSRKLGDRVARGRLLADVAPSILGSTPHFFSMELVLGQVLCSYYVHGEVARVLEWALKHLWVKHRVDPAYLHVCDKFYRVKTLERVAQQSASMVTEALVVNGVRTGTVSDVLARVDWAALATDSFCQFHGDFIMDNIIRTRDSYRLVDWRQDFGGDLEYGDMYYDLAKFRHNIIFNHSNVERKLFHVEVGEEGAVVDIKCNFFLVRQLEDFDKFVIEHGFDLKRIKILTAIVWLNMAPLHEYELGCFLFYFGKLNLALEISAGS